MTFASKKGNVLSEVPNPMSLAKYHSYMVFIGLLQSQLPIHQLLQTQLPRKHQLVSYIEKWGM